MTVIAELAAYLFARLSAISLTRKGVVDAATFLGLLVFCLALEWRKQRSIRRYAS